MLGAAAWAAAAAIHLRLPDAAAPAVAPPVRPHPVAYEAATLGHPSASASLLWARASIHFATSAHPDPRWLREAITACLVLDPRWKAPAVYGALILASLGDVEGHEAVLRSGTALWPEDPWFPTALGMSRYLYGGDRADAARWLRFAAATPGADPLLHRLAEAVEGGVP